MRMPVPEPRFGVWAAVHGGCVTYHHPEESHASSLRGDLSAQGN